MKLYDVIITEKHQIQVRVAACDEEEALYYAQERYALGDEEFDPLSNGGKERFAGVEFDVEEAASD